MEDTWSLLRKRDPCALNASDYPSYLHVHVAISRCTVGHIMSDINVEILEHNKRAWSTQVAAVF